MGFVLPSRGHRPFQRAVSSEHPLVVVSTTQVEDWDESSSFLMERLLQALSLASIDRMSAEERNTAMLTTQPQDTHRALLQSTARSSQVSTAPPLSSRGPGPCLDLVLRSGQHKCPLAPTSKSHKAGRTEAEDQSGSGLQTACLSLPLSTT